MYFNFLKTISRVQSVRKALWLGNNISITDKYQITLIYQIYCLTCDLNYVSDSQAQKGDTLIMQAPNVSDQETYKAISEEWLSTKSYEEHGKFKKIYGVKD